MTFFISCCCFACVGFGVIVGDGGKPVSKTGVIVADVVVGVDVKTYVGEGALVERGLVAGVQEDKILKRIAIAI